MSSTSPHPDDTDSAAVAAIGQKILQETNPNNNAAAAANNDDGDDPHAPKMSWTTYTLPASSTLSHGAGFVTLTPIPRPTPHSSSDVNMEIEIADDHHHHQHDAPKQSWTTYTLPASSTLSHGAGFVTLTPIPRPTKALAGEQREKVGMMRLHHHVVEDASRVGFAGGEGAHGVRHGCGGGGMGVWALLGLGVLVAAAVWGVRRRSRRGMGKGRIVLEEVVDEKEERRREKV
ncbi:hypothetical protein DM02DRAFT_673756 [Periconia macrospinosa]|uniref:Uncharacterized protein n=1 Tax=Periconia macrospinosa TaxID=97972 RepID=A0A2V1DIB6_9PLEO|nr:hypothetical protein DM02DRAFT_673756 [Periconia macrospinosa]